MLGRRERHRRRARGGGWPVNLAIKPWRWLPRLPFSSAVDMCASRFVGGCAVWFGQFAPASAGCGSRIVVLATASDSSSRRTSAKIAGTASSAIAPSTQNACWKPPVSAAGAAWPACSSAWVWLAATLEAIAIPIAPPSCWEVFSSPNASPA